MATHMKQVTKEEYEVLTRFHPGEIRYLVDTNKSISRRKGAKVTVKRKAAAPKVKATKKIGGRGSPNKHVQLTTNRYEYKPGSLGEKVQRIVRIELENDPTNVVGRSDLVNRATSSCQGRFTKSQINPIVSDMIKHGDLRYTGANAAG